ncbi:MAG: DUF4010 domain-containing protein [Candidatus Korarchaeota archaeon]
MIDYGINYSIDIELVFQVCISCILGLMIGMERFSADISESEVRKYGPRTSALVAILGTVAAHFLSYNPLIMLFAIGVAVIIEYHYVKYRFEHDPGLTTAVAISLTFISGAAIGFGEILSGAIIAIIVSFILSSKKSISQVVRNITHDEIIATLRLLIFSLVIYPLIPDGLLPYVSLRQIYLMFLFLLYVMFISYLFLREFGATAMIPFSFIGSFVNSESTAITLLKRRKEGYVERKTLYLSLAIVNVAYLLRCALYVLFGAPGRFDLAMLPLFMVIFPLIFSLLLYLKKDKHKTKTESGDSKSKVEHTLPPPYEIKNAAKFAFLFFVISIENAFVFTYCRELVLIGVILSSLLSASATLMSITTAIYNGAYQTSEGIFLMFVCILCGIANKFIYIAVSPVDRKEKSIAMIHTAIQVALLIVSYILFLKGLNLLLG